MNKAKLIPELKVFDFKGSKDFYTNVLGFEIIYERPEEDFAMLGLDGVQIMIEAYNDKSRSWIAGALERPLGRGMNLQIEVGDIDTLYERIKTEQYPIFQEKEEKWYRVNHKETGNRQFVVQDPDGYMLRFYQDLGMR